MRQLETQRLLLRELTPDDFESLYEVLADSDIMQHYPYTFDESRVQNWITKNIERYQIFGFGLWAVVLKETGEMIGDCGITMQNINGSIKPEIGYMKKMKQLWCMRLPGRNGRKRRWRNKLWTRESFG